MNQKTITDLLPSEELRNKIKEDEYKFTEHELVLIAEEYSETVNDKLEKLLYLAENLSEENERKFAKERAYKIESDLNNFAKGEQDMVFQVEIEDNPNAHPESYICKDYYSSLVTIAKYCKEYDVVFDEFSNITITKKTVISDSPDFLNDERGGVMLNEKLYPTFVWYEEKHQSYEEIETRRIESVKYPNILKSYSPVKFKDYYGYHYGLQINSFREDAYDDAYVIALDSTIFDGESLEDFCNAHEHISIPKLIQLEFADLPEKERASCERLIEYLKKKKFI